MQLATASSGKLLVQINGIGHSIPGHTLISAAGHGGDDQRQRSDALRSVRFKVPAHIQYISANDGRL
ncbi:hypothetical protein P3T22_003893 [Paraburkholderia sp. GAS348]